MNVNVERNEPLKLRHVYYNNNNYYLLLLLFIIIIINIYYYYASVSLWQPFAIATHHRTNFLYQSGGILLNFAVLIGKKVVDSKVG